MNHKKMRGPHLSYKGTLNLYRIQTKHDKKYVMSSRYTHGSNLFF